MPIKRGAQEPKSDNVFGQARRSAKMSGLVRPIPNVKFPRPSVIRENRDMRLDSSLANCGDPSGWIWPVMSIAMS